MNRPTGKSKFGKVSSSNSDSDDDALEALGWKFANEWDPDGLISHKISALSLEEQLANKARIEVGESLNRKYESLELVDTADERQMKAKSVQLGNAMKNTFKITKSEETNIPLYKPGRETIIPRLSGSLFSAGTKIGIETLLDEKKYSEHFEMTMRCQLTQDVEAINVNGLISNCIKFPTEERHCLAKYLLFAMSVCEDEMIVDTLYNSLLDFRDSWTLHLKDFMDIFINWGIPEKLLYPPSVFNDYEDTCSTKVLPDCNFEVADYNVFKVLAYISAMFDGKVRSDPESTMTMVRAVLLMWLDERLTNSWDSANFGLTVKRLVEGIDTDVESPEMVVGKNLNLLREHVHNQAWLIVKLLECQTTSACLVGRLYATQFLLHVFNCEPTLHPGGLDLWQLHFLLVSKSDPLSLRDLYSGHVVLLVVDAYLGSYPAHLMDKEALEAFVEWSHDMACYYSDDTNCEILDRKIIITQMKTINIKIKCCLEDFFNTDERKIIYWDQQEEDVDYDSADDKPTIDVVPDRVSKDESNVVHMDGVSDQVSEDQPTVCCMDVVSDKVSGIADATMDLVMRSSS